MNKIRKEIKVILINAEKKFSPKTEYPLVTNKNIFNLISIYINTFKNKRKHN